MRWIWFAAVLLPLGLALQELDHGVWIVLHHYAALFLIGLLALHLPTRWLLPLGVVMSVVGAVALLLLRMEFPDLPVREGVSISDPIGTILVGLTVSGPYPLITWISPFLIGMWLGRQDLRSDIVRSRLVLVGAGVTILALVASGALILLFGPVEGPRDWTFLLTDAPHSQMPLWLLGSAGTATMLIGLCLKAADRLGRLLWPIQAMGQVALSIYVGHVIVLHFWRGPTITENVGEGALILLAMSVAGCVLAVLWLAVFPRGPLELVLHAPLRVFAKLRGGRAADPAT